MSQWVAALVDAVNEETTITGVADFDALSATYGLMGIDRMGRMSSFFHGYQFRLMFPPGVDVAAIAGAYWNLSYVQSIEPEPPPETRTQKRPFDIENGGLRLLAKVAAGTASGGAFTVLVASAIANGSMGGHILGGLAIMSLMIVALTLFAILVPADAERLADMFSPILILAKETGQKWGDIKVTKPEPVEIMGATSAAKGGPSYSSVSPAASHAVSPAAGQCRPTCNSIPNTGGVSCVHFV